MKKILLIEDDLAYVKVLRDQLTKNGYEVIATQDGKEGLALAKSVHPDLILLDIKMPAMDGLTMLRALRKDIYGKSAKVIILTNLEPDEQMIGKVIKDLPASYLIKSDIPLVELIAKVKELLSD